MDIIKLKKDYEDVLKNYIINDDNGSDNDTYKSNIGNEILKELINNLFFPIMASLIASFIGDKFKQYKDFSDQKKINKSLRKLGILKDKENILKDLKKICIPVFNNLSKEQQEDFIIYLINEEKNE